MSIAEEKKNGSGGRAGGTKAEKLAGAEGKLVSFGNRHRKRE